MGSRTQRWLPLGVAVAMIAMGAPRVHAQVHEVLQIDLSFVPPEITVAPGDTVRWIWSTGFHTVTSGPHAACTFDGRYFNQALHAGNPIVEWVVPADLDGPVPYLCLPHCLQDMVGTIFIEESPTCDGDVDGDNEVDFDDILAVLDAWGPYKDCPPFIPADIDQDCEVGFSDLVIVLSEWGPCP